jgi:alkanesulfonate monooxygenase SsuD/methylene tetrahydromethanopterin reductase-like flavin-dependent oxidoreductase (luciferase family)
VEIDIQLSPATNPWPALRDGVLAAEAAGYTAAWVFDHLDGAMLGGGDSMLECFALCGALAEATSTIGIGTLVVNVANRNPTLMASSAATVQTISGGRFTLGLGAGAAPNTKWSGEHRAAGIELGATQALRHGRVADALDVCEHVWSSKGDMSTFPTPRPHAPATLLGVNSAPLARLAAERTGGVNVRGDHPQLDEILAAFLDARGDDPAVVSVWAHFDAALADPEHPARRRWQRLGVNRLVLVVLGQIDLDAISSLRWRAPR